MTIGKIKPTVTLAAQYVAGVEVDCIQHEGKLFLPIMTMGELGVGEPIPSKIASAKESVKETPTKKGKAVEETEEEATSLKVYTEAELIAMDTADILVIVEGMGIDPNDTEGRNTNKKLRTLVLDNQGEGVEEEDDEEDDDDVVEDDIDETEEDDSDDSDDDTEDDEDDEDDEEESDEEDTLVDEVMEVLEDFDAGKLTTKKVVSKLEGMSTAKKVNKKAIVKAVDDFEQDEEAEFEETAEAIANILEGVTPKKAKAEPKAKKGKKAKDVLVTPDELEKGQRVSVYWEDEEEWYDGEVASIRKGKVTIDYDDETSEILDENNTKIKLLS